MSILLLGFLVGIRHALEADHVAAVATLVSTSKTLKQSMRHGIAWGLGHMTTLFLFGSIVVVMDIALPSSFARALEVGVGLMLIVLGVDVVRRIVKERVHFHVHRHGDGTRHLHAHSHAGDTEHGESKHRHTHPKGLPLRSLLIGLMHGMAGSAALIVLTLGTVQSLPVALGYMLLFGFGSMLAMALLSAMIALPLKLTGKGLSWIHTGVQVTLGLVSCVIGGLLTYHSL